MTLTALPEILAFPGLDSFAEDDWTQSKGPRGGSVWTNKSGRKVYGKENPGKSKRKDAPAKAPDSTQEARSPAKAKADPDKARNAFRAALENPEAMTPEAEEALHESVKGLKMADARAILKELGSTAKGRSLVELTRKAAAEALARVRGGETAKAAAPPPRERHPDDDAPPPAPGAKTEVNGLTPEAADAIGKALGRRDSYDLAEVHDSLPPAAQEAFAAALLRLEDEKAIGFERAFHTSHFDPETLAKLPQDDGHAFGYAVVHDPDKVRDVLKGLASGGRPNGDPMPDVVQPPKPSPSGRIIPSLAKAAPPPLPGPVAPPKSAPPASPPTPSHAVSHALRDVSSPEKQAALKALGITPDMLAAFHGHVDAGSKPRAAPRAKKPVGEAEQARLRDVAARDREEMRKMTLV